MYWIKHAIQVDFVDIVVSGRQNLIQKNYVLQYSINRSFISFYLSCGPRQPFMHPYLNRLSVPSANVPRNRRGLVLWFGRFDAKRHLIFVELITRVLLPPSICERNILLFPVYPLDKIQPSLLFITFLLALVLKWICLNVFVFVLQQISR